MKRMLALVTLLLMGWLGQTAYAQVSSDYDHAINFSQYHTFAWVAPDINVGKNPIYNNPLLHQNIEATFGSELVKRGLNEQTSDPDLLVSFHTYTEKKTRPSWNYGSPMYYPYAFGWGRGFFPYGGFMPYGGYSNGGYAQVPYTQGTLVVDVTDAHSHQLVWRGVIQGAVDQASRLEKQVAKGIHKVMRDFPVRA